MREYQQGALKLAGKNAAGSLRSSNSVRRTAGSLGQGAAGFSDPYLSLSKDFGASPPSGMSAFGNSARAGVASLGGTIGKLFKKPSTEAGFGLTPSSQKLVGTGAEALIGTNIGGIEVSGYPELSPYLSLTTFRHYALSGPDEHFQEFVFETGCHQEGQAGKCVSNPTDIKTYLTDWFFSNPQSSLLLKSFSLILACLLQRSKTSTHPLWSTPIYSIALLRETNTQPRRCAIGSGTLSKRTRRYRRLCLSSSQRGGVYSRYVRQHVLVFNRG